ncbi:hypothetical protein [Streptomyces globisporus]|uniref:hypothetical protein n=1 Tax=Streptomyces globisporus TaxID=1908 RepID=UPI003689D550
MADDNQNDQNTETAPATLEEALALLNQERENVTKWKGLSRTNEDRWKEVSQERDQLKQATLTDSEKAIEQARQEARNAALSEVGTDLVSAEIRVQATAAGVQLPDPQFLNLNSFLGSDGRPNAEAIQTFVSSLPKPQQQGYRQDLGLGRQGGNAPGLSREEYNRMSREDRKKAREDGRVTNALLGGHD